MTDRDAAVDRAVAVAVKVQRTTLRDHGTLACSCHKRHDEAMSAAVRAAVEQVIATECEWADRLHRAVQHTLAAVNHTHGIGSCIGCVEAGEVMREYVERQRGAQG